LEPTAGEVTERGNRAHGFVGVRRERPRGVVSEHVRVGGSDYDCQQKQTGGARGAQPRERIRGEAEREGADDETETSGDFGDAGPVDVEARGAGEAPEAPRPFVRHHSCETIVDGEVGDAGGDVGETDDGPSGFGPRHETWGEGLERWADDGAALVRGEEDGRPNAEDDGGLRRLVQTGHDGTEIPRLDPRSRVVVVIVAVIVVAPRGRPRNGTKSLRDNIVSIHSRAL